MKKLLVLCTCLLAAGCIQAQTTAGRIMIGGNIGYSTYADEKVSFGEPESKSLTINPQLGYFVVDNLAVGLEAGYFNQTYTNNDFLTGEEVETKVRTTSVSPFVRYYIPTENEKFSFYAQALVGITSTHVDREVDEENEGSGFQARLSPGFTYFLSEKWGLDLQLKGITYSSTTWKDDANANTDDYEYTVFEFGASSFTPSLGFRYFIGK